MQSNDPAEKTKQWDFFISHASEDKEEIARPLADRLNSRGLMVWYADYSLKLGGNLRESIDYGLARSRLGIVILSSHFLEKHWPQEELNDLATREVNGKKVILPIWHKVGFQQVFEYSPVLADRVGISTDKGLEYVVQRMLKAAE
jgi:TIR domain